MDTGYYDLCDGDVFSSMTDGRMRVYRHCLGRYTQCCIQEVDRFAGGIVMVRAAISNTCSTVLVHDFFKAYQRRSDIETRSYGRQSYPLCIRQRHLSAWSFWILLKTCWMSSINMGGNASHNQSLFHSWHKHSKTSGLLFPQRLIPVAPICIRCQTVM